MAKDNDWKSRLQVVYSTNPDYNYVTDDESEAETLPKQQQKLRVHRRRPQGPCQTPQDPLRRRRLGQRRRNHHPGRLQAQSHRTTREGGVHEYEVKSLFIQGRFLLGLADWARELVQPERLDIPSTVKEIGTKAFFHSGVKEVVIPASALFAIDYSMGLTSQ